MRLSKEQRRHVAKLEAREQSMRGWEVDVKQGVRQSMGVGSMRPMLPEHGFHFARRMRTRIA